MDNWSPSDLGLSHDRRPELAQLGHTPIRVGDKVRLRPLGRADVMDIALEGKLATVVSVEEDFENRTYLAVTIDEDPGQDYGRDGKIGHRFFFGIDEVEPSTHKETFP